MSKIVYFVIVRGQRGHPLPIIDQEQDLCLFETREQAEKVANGNILGEHYGFEIIEWSMPR